MDYFGRLVDDLTDIFESIEASPASADAGEVLKALQKVMVAAAKAERIRNARSSERSTHEPSQTRSSSENLANGVNRNAA